MHTHVVRVQDLVKDQLLTIKADVDNSMRERIAPSITTYPWLSASNKSFFEFDDPCDNPAFRGTFVSFRSSAAISCRACSYYNWALVVIYLCVNFAATWYSPYSNYRWGFKLEQGSKHAGRFFFCWGALATISILWFKRQRKWLQRMGRYWENQIICRSHEQESKMVAHL